MEIQGGVASSTHVDDQGQRIAKELLDEMAVGIRAAYVPLLVDHDFNQQVGVVLNARVIDLGDGEHALLVVNGIFDDGNEASDFPNGAQNSVFQDFDSTMDEVESAVRQEYDAVAHPDRQDRAEELSLAERLGLFLDATEVMPDGTDIWSRDILIRWVISQSTCTPTTIHHISMSAPNRGPSTFVFIWIPSRSIRINTERCRAKT